MIFVFCFCMWWSHLAVPLECQLLQMYQHPHSHLFHSVKESIGVQWWLLDRAMSVKLKGHLDLLKALFKYRKYRLISHKSNNLAPSKLSIYWEEILCQMSSSWSQPYADIWHEFLTKCLTSYGSVKEIIKFEHCYSKGFLPMLSNVVFFYQFHVVCGNLSQL